MINEMKNKINNNKDNEIIYKDKNGIIIDDEREKLRKMYQFYNNKYKKIKNKTLES